MSLGMQRLEKKRETSEADTGGPRWTLTEDRPSPCKSRLWQFGVTVFTLGSALNFGCLGLAPQSLLSALQSIQFVTNLFFGWLLFGKRITLWMQLGTVLTVGGTVSIVLFSARSDIEPKNV